MDIQGKLAQKLTQQTGQGKNGAWVKQEFILETQEQYPRKVCISLWGDKVKDLENFSIDDVLKVFVNIESREFNGRWYTDVRAWKIERVGNSNDSQDVTDLPPFNDDFLPHNEPTIADGLPF